MKRKPNNEILFRFWKKKKNILTMKLLICFILLSILEVSGSVFSQHATINLSVADKTVKEVFRDIESISEYRFLYNDNFAGLSRTVSVNAHDDNIKTVLDELLAGVNLTYKELENNLIVITPTVNELQDNVITGIVTGVDGTPIPGATIIVRGTTRGTTTNADGAFRIEDVPPGSILVISFVGMISKQILIEDQRVISIILEEDAFELEEVVAIGYGTMRRSDLTGSVVRADIASFRQSPNVSIMQSLHGSVPGLAVSQVNQAGQEPEMLIRGASSLSGELAPLIVLDGVIFRGSIIDINPNDIESIDILKDASSAAIYGSQATNGVILITTTRSGGVDGKPTIHYSGSYAFQSPIKFLKPPGPDGFAIQQANSDIFQSRTSESGYLDRNPNFELGSTFDTSLEIVAYEEGRSTDWYELVTNDNMYTNSHNLSLSNRTDFTNYMVSIGYTGVAGYMVNEDYERLNARINIDNTVTDWLEIGIQSFLTQSDYSGQQADARSKFFMPYFNAYDPVGSPYQFVAGNQYNPIIVFQSDLTDKRLNLFGNIYADVKIPFIEGLSYRFNAANNYQAISSYFFRPYLSSFQGTGSKMDGTSSDLTSDNILTYNRVFNNIHTINTTIVYGMEKRSHNSTQATASNFLSHELGYNRLQAGDAEFQQTASFAWEEASLYQMARFFYGFDNRYMITGTIRRDGFSGFGEDNKFGVFPSLSLAWVISEESFLAESSFLDYLKLRTSYGSVGNRTIGRYQTIAKVQGGFEYVTLTNSPLYTQNISSLASPNLKWETTTGVNIGVDFGLAGVVHGSVDYYNNNTTNLLYEVDIPSIGRFEKFPDNLGKLHNQGLELKITSLNLKRSNFEWSSTFSFSRNRNTLKELLGFDLTGDGKEDDLISEGLFIGESIAAIYDYKIDGMWQIGEDIPSGYDIGAYRVVDLNIDGVITPDDRTIIGYSDPSYMFSILNSIRYKELTLTFFINSIQGGKNYYLAEDTFKSFSTINHTSHLRYAFPDEVDFWLPENPNARYQRPGINVSEGIAGKRYASRSFIRLQDISLSYDIPSSLSQRLNLSNLRIYLNGKNLLTLTDWRGWDPETGATIDMHGRPVLKSFTFGINFDF